MSSSAKLELFNKRKVCVASVNISTGLAGWSAETSTAKGDSWLRLRLRLCPQQPDLLTNIALLMASNAADDVDRQLQACMQPENPGVAQPTPPTPPLPRAVRLKGARFDSLDVASLPSSSLITPSVGDGVASDSSGSEEESVTDVDRQWQKRMQPENPGVAQPTPPTPPLPRAVRLKGARFDSLDVASLPSSSLITPSVGDGVASDSSGSEEESGPADGIQPAAEHSMSAAPAAPKRIPSVLRSGLGRRTNRVQRRQARGKSVFGSRRSSAIQLVTEPRVTAFAITRGEVQAKQQHVRWIHRLRQKEQEDLSAGRPAAGDEWSDSDEEFGDASMQANQQLHLRDSIERDNEAETSSEEEDSPEDGDSTKLSTPDNKDSASSASEDDDHSEDSGSSDDGDDEWSD